MVIKNNIKEIHNKLSQTKIDSFKSIISASTFSSILKDRFVAELKKMNIVWDLTPTTIDELVKGNKTSKFNKINSEIVANQIKFDKNINIGIDIQLISNLPISKDPWEDQFYIDNFNKNEITHCLKKKNIYESFAGIFALKEAIYKIDKTNKKDVKIKFLKNGKPINDKYSISISHDKEYAIGIAVLNQFQLHDSKEIITMNDKIDRNKNIIENFEQKLNLIYSKTSEIYYIYILIAFICLYLFYRDFLI